MSSLTITTRRFILNLFLMGTLFLAPMTLILATPSTAMADANEEARERFMEGRQHYEDGDYLEAAEKFLEAYELSDRSELLFNVGQAYRRADALGRAEEYFQQYLNEQPDAPNADAVVETIIEIQREKAARMATLTVTTEPRGASIFVDAEPSPRCQSPCDIDLDPGSYTLRAELSGHESTTTQVELDARQESETGMTLQAESATGRLHVRSDSDGVTLIAGGRSYPVPTARPVELQQGSQSIALQWSGGGWEQNVDIIAGETLHIFVPASVSGEGFSPLRASAVGLGGAALAFAGAGAIMGHQASSSHAALQAQQEAHGEVNSDLLQTGQRQQFSANIMWVGALVSLGAGAGLWVWDSMRSGGSDSSESLEPTSEQDASGLDLL